MVKCRLTEVKVQSSFVVSETAFASFLGIEYVRWRGSTLDQIATSANLSKPNVLYYFPSKDAIYTAILERLLQTWLDPLRALDARGKVDAGKLQSLDPHHLIFSIWSQTQHYADFETQISAVLGKHDFFNEAEAHIDTMFRRMLTP